MLTNIGKHCDHPECHLLDFLPFTCDSCKSTFCLDHHKYADHDCKIGRAKKNLECKTCSLCSQVVPIQISTTAEQSLQIHISNGCPQERKRGPKCVECQKGLLVPMHCSACNECVCPKHRHSLDHRCGVKKAPVAQQPKSSPIVVLSQLKLSSNPPTAVAAAALKRVASPAPCPSSPTLPTSPEPDTIPLSIMLSSSLNSTSPSSSAPCRVYAKKSWDVETAVRALCKNFNMSPEGLCLLMSGSDTAIARDLPLGLIADEIQGTTLVLERETSTHGDVVLTTLPSCAVSAN